MIQVDTHLLGSRDGYTTFAKSVQLATDEQRELEELVYGQPDDPAIHASLATEAVAMVRRLRSTGRFALSRILTNTTDGAGRKTIAVCTLIMSPRDYQSFAQGDMWKLIHSPQLWSIDLFAKGHQINLPRPPAIHRAITATDVALFDAWIVAKSRANAVAVIGSSDIDHRAVVSLSQVLDPANIQELTWGCRLLSIPSGIGLATTVQRGVEQTSRRAIVSPTESPTTPLGKRSLALVRTIGVLPSASSRPATSIATKKADGIPFELQADSQDQSESTWHQEWSQSRGTFTDGSRVERPDQWALAGPLKKWMLAGGAVVVLLILLLSVALLIPRLIAAQACERAIADAKSAENAATAHARTAEASDATAAMIEAASAENRAEEARVEFENADQASQDSGWPFTVDTSPARLAADAAKISAQRARTVAREKLNGHETKLRVAGEAELIAAKRQLSQSSRDMARTEFASAKLASDPLVAKGHADLAMNHALESNRAANEASASLISVAEGNRPPGAVGDCDSAMSAAKEAVAYASASAVLASKLRARAAMTEAESALSAARASKDRAVASAKITTAAASADAALEAATLGESELERTKGFECASDAQSSAGEARSFANRARAIAVAGLILDKKLEAQAEEKYAAIARSSAELATDPTVAGTFAQDASNRAAAADIAAGIAESRVSDTDGSDFKRVATQDAKAARQAAMKAMGWASDATLSAKAKGNTLPSTRDPTKDPLRGSADASPEFTLTIMGNNLASALADLTTNQSVDGCLTRIIQLADELNRQTYVGIENYAYVDSDSERLSEYAKLLFLVRMTLRVVDEVAESLQRDDTSEHAKLVRVAKTKLHFAWKKLKGVGDSRKNYIEVANLEQFFESVSTAKRVAPSITDTWGEPKIVDPRKVALIFGVVRVGSFAVGGPISLESSGSTELVKAFKDIAPLYATLLPFDSAINEWVTRRSLVVSELVKYKKDALQRWELPPDPLTELDVDLENLKDFPIQKLSKLSESARTLRQKWEELKRLHEDQTLR